MSTLGKRIKEKNHRDIAALKFQFYYDSQHEKEKVKHIKHADREKKKERNPYGIKSLGVCKILSKRFHFKLPSHLIGIYVTFNRYYRYLCGAVNG